LHARPNQGWLTSGRWYLNCDSCLTYECVRTGNHVVRTSVSIFPYFELGKNMKLIDHWWTSGRAAEMSGRMQAGTEASRYSGGFGRKDTSSGWMEQWTDGRPDGMTLHPDGWHGIWILLSSMQSLLNMLWQVESLFTAPLHISDFVQTQNEAKILTNLINNLTLGPLASNNRQLNVKWGDDNP